MRPVVTQQYHFPPAGLAPAEECTHEQLLELAMLACRSPSDLGALQRSPDRLRLICELLGELHKRAIAQEHELGNMRARLAAAKRMADGAYEQAAVVRNSLGIEVASHRATKQQADQEHELRMAAEEELQRVSANYTRDSARVARAMRLLDLAFDRMKRVVDTFLDLRGDEDEEVTHPNVRALDTCPDVGADICAEEETIGGSGRALVP